MNPSFEQTLVEVRRQALAENAAVVELQMARSGKKVMQFLSEGRYVANAVDGKVTLYGR